MNKRETLFAALRHEPVNKTPWVPFAGVHAGRLTGDSAAKVLTDDEALFRALLEVNKLYSPSGQPVIFDLQVEAEALGCQLLWTDNAPPSVKTHPLADSMAVPCRCTLPTPESGRLPMILSTMRRMKAEVGDETALYGLICGPFTLASHLRGNDIFMDMYDDGEYVLELLDYCRDCANRMAGLYIGQGMDVIAVVDPLVSQISPAHFERFLSASFKSLFSSIRDMGAYSSFFVCGDAGRNIDPMCKTGPDSISVDENVDLFAAKRITDSYNIAIGGNIPLTTVMLHGTQQDNMKYVVDLLDGVDSRRNLIIAPGCDMPYNTPVENAIAAAQAVADPEMARRLLGNYVADGFDVDVELPDYCALKRPLMEVFTLDSTTCAACTYMLGAAMEAAACYEGEVEVVERRSTDKETIARCKKMGVSRLPSIYINGELKFASIIPSSDQLLRELDVALEAAGIL